MKLIASLLAVSVAATFALSGCGGSDDSSERSVGSLRLIGQQILLRRSVFNNTVVGGLSGIDYDAANNRYVLISDDRTTGDSASAPHMFTANLVFDANSFSAVNFLSTFAMRLPDGSVYPKLVVGSNPGANVPDPESVRVDPVSGNYLWTSEGARVLSPAPAALINPFVREIKPDGTHVREYSLPAMFQMSAATPDVGPRNNLVFEGITVTPDRLKTVVIMEGALFQDAAAPTTTAGSVSRITVFDRASGVAQAQYAYPVEKIQAEPSPASSFSVNGATEILAITNTKFLVLERSFSVGVNGNQVRLYEIDTAPASNVLNMPVLAGASFTPVSKRLVLDFETLKTRLGNNIANLEGITFGPRLANGNDTLVVVADDNLPTADSVTDFNQFLVFEVLR